MTNEIYTPKYHLGTRIAEAGFKIGGAIAAHQYVPELLAKKIEGANLVISETWNQAGVDMVDLYNHVGHLANLYSNFENPLATVSQFLAGILLASETIIGDRKTPETVGKALRVDIVKAGVSAAAIAAPSMITELPHIISNLIEGQRILSSIGELGIFVVGSYEIGRAIISMKSKYTESRNHHIGVSKTRAELKNVNKPTPKPTKSDRQALLDMHLKEHEDRKTLKARLANKEARLNRKNAEHFVLYPQDKKPLPLEAPKSKFPLRKPIVNVEVDTSLPESIRESLSRVKEKNPQRLENKPSNNIFEDQSK